MSNAHRKAKPNHVGSRNVVDGLTALYSDDLASADMVGYALADARIEPIIAMFERAHHHTVLMESCFAKLCDHETPEAAWSYFASILLVYASQLAVALVPARSLDDIACKTRASGSSRDIYRPATPNEARRAALLRQAYDASDAPAALFRGITLGGPQFVSNPLVPGRQTQTRIASGASCHGPSDASALAAYAQATGALHELLAFAKRELRRADAWHELDALEGDMLGPAEEAACHARLRAYAALASIALWPARSGRDPSAKAEAMRLVASRVHDDPARLRAAVELAEIFGGHLSELGHTFEGWFAQ